MTDFIDVDAGLTGVYKSAIAWADFDNDGDLDLLTTGLDADENPSTKIYDNDGSGGFTENTNTNLTDVNSGSVATADYDKDGDYDFLIAGLDASGTPTTRIYDNDGSGGFSENTNVALPGTYTSSVAWGDYNNDLDLDLLIAGYDNVSDPITKIYINDGSGGFAEDTNVVLDGVGSGSVATGDFDGQNGLDILVTGYDSSDFPISKIYANNGSGGFTASANAALEGVYFSSVATGDFDGDNDLDLLVTGQGLGNSIAKIYTNDSSGVFSEDPNFALGGISSGSVAVGDYDGDDDLDLLVTGFDGNDNPISQVYDNNGSGEFSENTNAILDGVSFSSVAWGDYDGDLDLDLAISGFNDSGSLISKIYRNDSGRDNLSGTDGDDILDGGLNNDTLNGSLGADSMIGGLGMDRVIYANSPAAVTVDLLAGTGAGASSHAEGDTYDSIENADGSRFADTMIGNNNDNRLYGGKDNDTLTGNEGDDYLSGQNGDDILSGSAGKDRLLGGNGADILMGDGGNDIVSGGNGADTITGVDVSNSGVGEIDRLSGGAGADIFVLATDTAVFYDDGVSASNGIADYAHISDFDATEDAIVLSSSKTYYLDVNPYGTSSGTGIYIDNDSVTGFSSEDELVGLLADTTITVGMVDGATPGFNLV